MKFHIIKVGSELKYNIEVSIFHLCKHNMLHVYSSNNLQPHELHLIQTLNCNHQVEINIGKLKVVKSFV